MTLALAERAVTGDCQATRVLVQFLLPCCVRLAFARHRPHLGSRDRVLDDLLTAAWDVVRTGVEQPGRAMKLTLLRKIEYRALRQPSRSSNATPSTKCSFSPEDICAMDRSEPSNINSGEEVVQLLVQATALGLNPGDARLLGGLFVGGWSAENWVRRRGSRRG